MIDLIANRQRVRAREESRESERERHTKDVIIFTKTLCNKTRKHMSQLLAASRRAVSRHLLLRNNNNATTKKKKRERERERKARFRDLRDARKERAFFFVCLAERNGFLFARATLDFFFFLSLSLSLSSLI